MPSLPSASPSHTYDAKHTHKTGNSIDWSTAKTLTDFTFPWLEQKAPTTEFRGIWDDEKLFFRFNVADSDIVLADGANAKDRVIGSDRVELFFSADRNLTRYYALEIDPRGNVLDYEAHFHRRMNWEWSCADLEVYTTQTNIGYQVDASIPLSTFRNLGCLHCDDESDYLIAGLYRAEFSHGPTDSPTIENWISWINPNVATPDFHVPSSFGTIRFAH